MAFSDIDTWRDYVDTLPEDLHRQFESYTPSFAEIEEELHHYIYRFAREQWASVRTVRHLDNEAVGYPRHVLYLAGRTKLRTFKGWTVDELRGPRDAVLSPFTRSPFQIQKPHSS